MLKSFVVALLATLASTAVLAANYDKDRSGITEHSAQYVDTQKQDPDHAIVKQDKPSKSSDESSSTIKAGPTGHSKSKKKNPDSAN